MKGFIGLVIKSSLVLFKIQSDRRVYPIPRTYLIFSLNASDRNFENAIWCLWNIGKRSFDWKLNGLVPFLIVENHWWATNPPPTPTISPNISNQNFEIAVLFKAIERSKIMSFRMTTHPHSPQAKGCKFC